VPKNPYANNEPLINAVYCDEWAPLEGRDYNSFFNISGLLSSVESLITSLLSTGDWLPPFAFVAPFVGLFPQPFTRICLYSSNQFLFYGKMSPISGLESDKERTFNASFLEKLFSQCPHGNGFTAKWIRLCRFKSWLRLKDCGHWSHLNGRSFCCCCCPG
jgi:hypothetical protein